MYTPLLPDEHFQWQAGHVTNLETLYLGASPGPSLRTQRKMEKLFRRHKAEGF